MSREPVRTFLIPVVLAALAAFVQALNAHADTRAIVCAVLGALVLAGQELARSKVTPVARAKRSTAAVRGHAGYISVELVVGILVGVVIVLLILVL